MSSSNYRHVTWAEVKEKNRPAYDRFKDHRVAVWLRDERMRLIFTVLLDGAHPTVDNVLTLFRVKAKHNWRWIGTRPNDEVICLTVGAGIQGVMMAEYAWSVHSWGWN